MGNEWLFDRTRLAIAIRKRCQAPPSPRFAGGPVIHLAKLRAKHGVIAIMGNHDGWHMQGRELKRFTILIVVFRLIVP